MGLWLTVPTLITAYVVLRLQEEGPLTPRKKNIIQNRLSKAAVLMIFCLVFFHSCTILFIAECLYSDNTILIGGDLKKEQVSSTNQCIDLCR